MSKRLHHSKHLCPQTKPSSRKGQGQTQFAGVQKDKTADTRQDDSIRKDEKSIEAATHSPAEICEFGGKHEMQDL